MPKYCIENNQGFKEPGVQPKDLKAMKIEHIESAFEDTEKDFDNLLEQLAAGIKEGRWNSILGDDVSARLPALVVGKIATRYAKEHEMKIPKQIFFSGGSADYDDKELDDVENISEKRQENLKDYIENQAKNLGERTLIITEHIVKGQTVKRIAEALSEAGINFDVATLWTVRDEQDCLLNFKDSKQFKNTKFFIGKENAGCSGPFGSQAGGLDYDLGVPLNEAAGIKKSGLKPVVKLNKEADRDLVVLARQKATELADKLYEKHFGNS